MCDEKTLREVFKEFDADGSGSIDLKELKAVLKAYFEAVKEPADEKKVDELAKDIMAAIDSSGDGSISVDEFIAVFKQ